MPSNTFYNLSEEKKQRIFNAIYLELKRVPLPEMSINRIIKSAEIPRGSFYQYFKNKDDAFDFFVDESSKKIKENVIKRISSAHGDIFELCETVFDEIICTAKDREWKDINQHIVPYVNFNKLEPISRYIENMEREKRLEACSSLGIGNFYIKDEDELMDIIGVIEAVFQSGIREIISGLEESEEIKRKFSRRLSVIKRAVLKEEK
jgi:AcrR family transcriptional regulator